MNKKIGILLTNLGTPEGTDFWSVRTYLKEFLSDKRVIEAKGPVWWAILNGVILTIRPGRSGHAYAQIWNNEANESPLKTITRAQAEGVAKAFSKSPDISVDWAMRYGKPSLEEGTNRLIGQGCTHILVFPLYPQYSAATTATAMDKFNDALRKIRHQPEVRSVPPYFDDDGYISAVADSIQQHQSTLDWQPDAIVASFHGLPVDFITNGDPYQAHCEKTAQLLRDKLKLSSDQFVLSYQSRTGRAVWIGPDTEDTLTELANNGKRKVLVVTPGFSSDCVETLEEIQIRAAEVFANAGGEQFSFVPCLNSSDASVAMMKDLIVRELSGWI